MNIWTFNAGSSSLKLAIFAARGTTLTRDNCVLRTTLVAAPGEEPASLAALQREQAATGPDVIAHRVVHGGDLFAAAVPLDVRVTAAIEKFAALAPLHNPVALRWINACQSVFGTDARQVAVFDTAFFAALPEVAWRYAIPKALADRNHLRRYGFHGLAHRSMWQQFAVLRPDLDRGGRLVTLQLGAGCSVAAILRSEPQDCSMGFSPNEGLVMATRAGDIDSGLLLHLQRELGYDAQSLEALLTRQSGLIGLSDGVSSSAGELTASRAPAAQLAVDIYCYRAAKYVGAYATVLSGIDGVVFGGGVGTNVAPIRDRIVSRLGYLGSIDVRTLQVDEELALAQDAKNVCTSA